MPFKTLKNYLPVLCLFLILTPTSLPPARSSEITGPSALNWRVMPVDDPDQPQYAHWYDFIKLGEQRARLKPGREVRDIHPQGDYYPHVGTIGRGLKITVPRAFARPGDRFVEVFVEIESGILEDNEHVHLEAALFKTGRSQPAAEREVTPETRVGLLKVDMRRHDLTEARLQVCLYASDERLAVAEVGLSAQPAERPLKEGEQIAVDIDTPRGIDRDEAVALTFGVPFPAGSLWDPHGVRLVNDKGEAVASQSEVTGRWSQEGAVKWMRFDAVAVPDEGLKIEMSPQEEGRVPARPLSVEESDESVIVETGAARYELSTGASPIKRIGQNGREVATSAGAKGLYVIDQEGRLGVSSADGQTMEVESAGPTAACVRFEGYYRTEGGEQLARHITRVELFAGLPQAKVTHTLVLSRDSNEVWFRDIGWELAVAPGAGAAGIFGVAHAEQDRYVEVSLDEETPVAYILQEEHLRFGKGDNHFEVASLDREGGSETVDEGERMGDWSALHGEAGGLMAAVRDAALQHPKEFELSADRLNIRLFSDRAGEELDFRAETLAEKWNLPETYGEDEVVVRERVAGYESNAIGWSKTHDLILSPVSADGAAGQSIEAARLNSGRVYGHVDPWWIYETRALGPLHPKDTENYAGAEATVDELVETFNELLRGRSFYGFVDYNAGPTFHPRGPRGDLVKERRFSSTYQLRPDLWGLYARSGERSVRRFTENTNRTFADNYMAHWDGPGKTRGLFVEGRNESPPIPHLGTGDLPFYWEDQTVFNRQDGSTFEHVVNDYFLTGNRRARDVTEQFVEGMKRDWTPRSATRRKRKVMTYRAMLHAYYLTLDPEFRVLTEATISYIYDPEGRTGLTKNKELGATYKARGAVRALIEGWETFGTPVHYDMARRMGEHKWNRYVPLGGTTSPFAIVGNFLYRETGSLYYAERMNFFLQYAPQRQVSIGPFRAADITTGIPLAQDVMANYGEKERDRAAWAAYQDRDASSPLRIAVSKGVYDNVDVYFTTRSPRGADTSEWVRPLDPPSHWRSRDRSLISMESSSNLPPQAHGHIALRVNIPKEAPGEAYAISPLHHGSQYVTGVITPPEVLQLEPQGRKWTQPYSWKGHLPMVLCAPKGWRTATGPADARVYFKQPEGVSGGSVYFSQPTELFTPAGEPFDGVEAVSGWVELPADNAGLWSFKRGRESKDIEVRNLPPFFAFGDPVHYFQPAIPWVEWTSPVPGTERERGEELAVEFKVHLAGEGEVKEVKVYLGDELLYEGQEAPKDLVLEAGELDAGDYELKVIAGSGQYSESYVFGIKVAGQD